MTPKERNLLKGAIRRTFSRSELRKQALETTRISHSDPDRNRVKKWSMCPTCKVPTPTYLVEVDHKEPIIPVDKSLEELTWDEVVNRTWCDISNLQPICKKCHTEKTKGERNMRKSFRKGNKK